MRYGQKGKVVKLWRELQRLEAAAAKKSPKGVFSVPGHKAATAVAKVLGKWMPEGACLDVGCGCLPRPSYMPVGRSFLGIDPFAGGTQEFPFAQALGEALPFSSGSFQSILFASSLDHFINPQLGLREAKRVLVSKGSLYIWYSRRGGQDYIRWQKARKKHGAAKYNPHHQWAWTDETMAGMVKKCGFKVEALHKFGHKNRLLRGVTI